MKGTIFSDVSVFLFFFKLMKHKSMLKSVMNENV